MRCKYCSYPDSKIVQTYKDNDERFVYRRRECIKCGARYTTSEHLRDNYKRPPFKTLPPNKVLPK